MENTIKHTYHIGGMTCGGCAMTVKAKLSTAQGVESVYIDLSKNEADITSNVLLKADSLQHTLTNTQYTISELYGVE